MLVLLLKLSHLPGGLTDGNIYGTPFQDMQLLTHNRVLMAHTYYKMINNWYSLGMRRSSFSFIMDNHIDWVLHVSSAM